MSTESKERFDTYFKVFIAAAIAFFGWLGSRTINQFDGVKADIQSIRINSEGMKKDIDWLKSELNRK